MLYEGDDLFTKQHILRVWYDNSLLFLRVKCAVTEISFSNANSGDQEKI